MHQLIAWWVSLRVGGNFWYRGCEVGGYSYCSGQVLSLGVLACIGWAGSGWG